MNTVKSLAIIAVLIGGTSLAMAQNGQPTGAYPPVGGGAGGNPATNAGPPGPGVIPHDASRSAAPTGTAGTRIAPTTRHHRIYMFSRHRPMKTGQPLPKQPQ